MGISLIDVDNYYRLFRSNNEAYGTTNVLEGEYDDHGKLRAKSRLIKSNPTPAVISRHLNGEMSIGLLPIDETGKCHWGAIDIDNYNRSLIGVVNAIYDFDMPLCPFYSKSKKLHLYLFLSNPIQPNDMQDLLRRYYTMFALDIKTETYPRQRKLEDVNTPSWINVPYFGNTRCMVSKGGGEVELSQALQRMNAKQMSIKEHHDYIDSMPFSDAPPCVQRGCIMRDIERGGRNNFLFSVGVYFRLKDENADLDSLLKDVNNSLQDPIEEKRLEETILTGMKKKSYFYLCDSMDGCNKEQCSKREYGIESKETTGLDYGLLEQYKTDPPYYVWTISGKKMVFYSEAEMLHQAKFRELCHRYLHIVPRKIDDGRWTKILNRANQNIIIHENKDEAGGFSQGSQFLQHTIDFFASRRPAEDKSQLALGRTWFDAERNRYVFKATAYLAYIRNIKDFKVYSPIELQTKLQVLGAVQEEGYWTISKDKIPTAPILEVDIDFHDKDDPKEEF